MTPGKTSKDRGDAVETEEATAHTARDSAVTIGACAAGTYRCLQLVGNERCLAPQQVARLLLPRN